MDSHSHIRSGRGLSLMTQGWSSRYGALTWNQRPALIDVQSGETWSYAELDARVSAIARQLHQVGVSAGDHVAYVCKHSMTAIAVLYAISRVGAVWVPGNWKLRPQELARQLLVTDCSVLVYDEDSRELAEFLLEAVPHLTKSLAWPSPTMPSELLDPSGPIFSDRTWCAMLPTSGTTGEPKAAVHSHRSWLGWTASLTASLGWRSDDRILNPYPMFHMGGTGFTVAALQTGAALFVTDQFDPATIVRVVDEAAITAIVMVPTMIQQILSLPEAILKAWPWRRVRQITTTSAPLLRDTAAAIGRRWPWATLCTMYSATEALYSVMPVVGSDRPRSVGRPAWGMELIVTDDRRRPVTAGEQGLIYGRGISVFTGYYQNAAANRAGFEGSWFTSQDIGYLDEDGYLYVMDRQGDMIHSGGERIASVEVEDRLLQHPAVEEVAVIALADSLWGERVHAVVVPRAGISVTSDELQQWCRIGLSRFKCPKSIEFVTQIPKGPTGKILKRALRDDSRGAPERSRNND